MANLDILTYGFSFVADQGGLGWSTISLHVNRRCNRPWLPWRGALGAP